MRICHVITRMIVGGAQENTLFTLRGHLEHGHEAVLITGPSTGPEGKLLQRNKLPGLKIIVNDHLVRDLNPIQDCYAYGELKRVFAEEQYDIVHTHSSKAGILARLAARRAGIPVVVHTVHGSPFHAYETWWRNRLYITAERFAANYCDRIYTVADAMTKQYLDAGIARPERYQTVYSGMDLEPFLNGQPDIELRSELGIPEDCPVIGKIARLFELKGYDFLIEAAPLIVAEVPNVRFLIVGDGVLRSQLEAQIQQLGLSKHFVFTGLVAPSEIHRYTALMDVLVHLSLREGLPRTVVQALASAKPAIGFTLDGTPEVIHHNKTGMLCEPENAVAVAAAATELLKQPDHCRQLGQAGREFVRERWNWQAMVAQLEADYETLRQGAGATAS